MDTSGYDGGDFGDGFGEIDYDDEPGPIPQSCKEDDDLLQGEADTEFQDWDMENEPEHVRQQQHESDLEGEFVDQAAQPITEAAQVPLVHHFAHHDLDPEIRHVYTQSVVEKVQGQSTEKCDRLLRHGLATVKLCGRDPEGQVDTARRATSALGADPDPFINRFLVCPAQACWNLTPMSQLNLLETDKCEARIGNRRCNESVFNTTGGVRQPYKVMPYQKLSTFLGLFLQDSKNVELLQRWKATYDEPPHHVLNREVPYLGKEVPLSGISQGSAWRSFGKETVRRSGGDWLLEEHPDQQRHVDEEFGLQIILNCDW